MLCGYGRKEGGGGGRQNEGVVLRLCLSIGVSGVISLCRRAEE